MTWLPPLNFADELVQAQALKGTEVISALLHFVTKELAGRLPRYVEADVIALAHNWLTAAEPSRTPAHSLLTSRLARTDTVTRHAIVQEWTARLRSAVEGGGVEEGGTLAGGLAMGFSVQDGPAIVVLAVIGSHFHEALDHATAERVANGLARAVASTNMLHTRVASHLLSRGAVLWSRYLKAGAVALFRVLYARYWRYQDFGTSLSDAEAALRSLAPVLPTEFVEVLGEEASRHSQLVCNARSERSGKIL